MSQRPQPASIAGITGGWIVGSAVILFAIITVPPLGLILGFVLGLVALVKSSERRRQRKAEQAHRARMDQFYGRCDERQMTATWTNPGWRV